MAKFLAVYLVVTGIGALLALAMPGLVILGFFLLIIPGLLLSLAPTAFMWGCIFAASWWICRSVMGDVPAAVAAAAITAAILFAIPSGSRAAGQKLLDASILPDLLPADPIRPAGDIRLDLAQPRLDNKNRAPGDTARAFACDNLCIGLLFTPGVTSVTVNSSIGFSPEHRRQGDGALAREARTYRLVPRAECGDRAIEPDLEGRVGLFAGKIEEMRAVTAEWNLRLATEVCVVAEPPHSRFDLQIWQNRYQIPEGKPRFLRNWSLRNSPVEVSQVEIRDGSGKLLLRRLIGRVTVLARPFSISASGGLENFRFHWSRQQLSNGKRYEEVDLLKVLEAHTTIAGRAASADLLPLVRAQLKRAVADPALPASDRSFGTMEAYFGGIKGAPLGEEDLALVTALILDDRLTDYRGLWELEKLPPDQHRQVGAAIVLRLLSAKDPLALRRAPFGKFLAKSPPGAFASLSDDEQALLASVERRVAVPGLVARLSDGGAASVPMLLDILRHHAAAWKEVRESRKPSPDRSAIVEAHSGMVSGARVALCRLGPAAASALPQVEAMIADGTIPPLMLEGHGGTDWNLMLLRLGKPLDQIDKPARLSGTAANYLRNMEKRVARFDPERSCGEL